MTQAKDTVSNLIKNPSFNEGITDWLVNDSNYSTELHCVHLGPGAFDGSAHIHQTVDAVFNKNKTYRLSFKARLMKPHAGPAKGTVTLGGIKQPFEFPLDIESFHPVTLEFTFDADHDKAIVHISKTSKDQQWYIDDVELLDLSAPLIENGDFENDLASWGFSSVSVVDESPTLPNKLAQFKSGHSLLDQAIKDPTGALGDTYSVSLRIIVKTQEPSAISQFKVSLNLAQAQDIELVGASDERHTFEFNYAENPSLQLLRFDADNADLYIDEVVVTKAAASGKSRTIS